MINSRKELKYYILADRMMNRGVFKYSLSQRLKGLFIPDYVMRYLETMRKLSYHRNKRNLIWMYYHWKFLRLGLKIGYSIGPDVFGYGLVLNHYGTIVVGGKNKIGNYAMIHTSTCITSTSKLIGDGLMVGTGAKITSCQALGNNVSIGANSVVTESFSMDNILLAGLPAIAKRTGYKAWYDDNEPFTTRYVECEKLRKQWGIDNDSLQS